MSEEEARSVIDGLLTEAGWVIQDVCKINLSAGKGIAVREFPTKSGPADYMLFVNRKAIGTIEAKKEGTTLSGVAEQTARYNASIPDKKLDHFCFSFSPAPAGLRGDFLESNSSGS